MVAEAFQDHETLPPKMSPRLCEYSKIRARDNFILGFQITVYIYFIQINCELIRWLIISSDKLLVHQLLLLLLFTWVYNLHSINMSERTPLSPSLCSLALRGRGGKGERGGRGGKGYRSPSWQTVPRTSVEKLILDIKLVRILISFKTSWPFISIFRVFETINFTPKKQISRRTF